MGNGYNLLLEGRIYVAIDNFPPVCEGSYRDERSRIDSSKAQLKRLTGLYEAFKGEKILTSEEVLKEIFFRREDKKNGKKNIKDSKNGHKSRGRNKGSWRNSSKGGEILDAREWLKIYNKMYNALKEGIKLYSPKQNVLNPGSIQKFIENYALSNIEKDLVLAALNTGNNTGIVSAKPNLLDVYGNGVEKFALRNCCAHNSIERRTTML